MKDEGRGATRETWIDNAKGIAILLIIIGHAGLGLTGPVNVLWVFGVHLVMFFLLSGYTLKRKELDRAFVNARFRRLMIPYFGTCFTIILMDVWNLFFWAHDLSVGTVTFWIRQDLIRSFFASGTFTKFGNIEIGMRIGALWFLPAMFFATFFCQGMLHITQNMWQFGLAAAGLAAVGMVSRNFIWLPFSIQSAMLASFFLWVGYLIRQKQLLEKLRWYHYAAAQAILLWGIYNGYCGTDFVTGFLNDILISPIVGISGCLLIYGLSRAIPKGLLAYMGRTSLTIMCVHLFSIETLRGYVDGCLNQMQLSGNPREWMRILIEIFIAVAGAALIEKFKAWSSSKEDIHKAINSEKDQRTVVYSPELISGSLFMLLYLAGIMQEGNHLLPIIRACIPAAFVFFAGYQRKRPEGICNDMAGLMCRYIVPWVIYLMGSEVFPEHTLTAAGRLLWYLLAVELLYSLLEYFVKEEFIRYALVLIISVAGMTVGRHGNMLPYGTDIALYMLIYYAAGVNFRKYRILEAAASNPWVYFIVSPVFVYMAYSGNADILMQKYGRYGSVVAGVLTGCALVYMLASWRGLGRTLPGKIAEKFGLIPFAYSVAVSGAFYGPIGRWMTRWFNSNGFLHFAGVCIIELAVAGLIYGIVWLISEKGIKALWKKS